MIDLEELIKMLSKAAKYYPDNEECISITYYETMEIIEAERSIDENYIGKFYGIGETSGKGYFIKYSDIDTTQFLYYI